MAKVLRGSSRTKSHRHRLCAAYGRDHFLLHKGKDSCFNGWFNHGNVALRALNKCETKIRNRLFRPIVVESSVEEIQVFGDVFVVRTAAGERLSVVVNADIERLGVSAELGTL